MKASALFCMVIFASAFTAATTIPRPAWTVRVTEKYPFRAFGLPKHSRDQLAPVWKRQQGVAFVAENVLAVYQVTENQDLRVEHRDASSGAGRYILQAVFFDSRTGEELRTLRLVTAGSLYSQILPTHDGNFLVQTGALIRLYSPTFQETTSRAVPLHTDARGEALEISVVPPGKYIHIKHSWTNGPRGQWGTEQYLLNSDNLQKIEQAHPSDIAFWLLGNALFPELQGEEPGVFADDGHWLHLNFVPPDNDCIAFVIQGLPGRGPGGTGVGGNGCKDLTVFARDGRMLWDIHIKKERIANFVSNGNLVALALYHHRINPLDLDLSPQPVGISLLDLSKRAERCHIPTALSKTATALPHLFFDLSDSGSLALLRGDELSVYKLEHCGGR
jgi:hypothetical protein